jgi:DNA-binding LacI/PurR family transcriptional regulator
LDRRAGYRQALQAAGIALDPELERLGHFTLEGGQAAMRQLLALAPRPSAVFAASDEMAYGAIRAIRRAGLTVPDDVAVIGFDDHATAELMDLSTVRQPVAEEGARLAQTLLTALKGAIEPTDLVLDTELVVRGSTVARASVYADTAG